MDLDELVVLEGEEACAEGEQIQGSREAAAAQTHTNPEQLQGPGVAATDTIASTGRHKRKGRSKGGVSNKGDGLLRADMVRDVYQWLGALCCGLSGRDSERFMRHLVPEQFKNQADFSCRRNTLSLIHEHLTV